MRPARAREGGMVGFGLVMAGTSIVGCPAACRTSYHRVTTTQGGGKTVSAMPEIAGVVLIPENGGAAGGEVTA